jgi:hypothetical protein
MQLTLTNDEMTAFHQELAESNAAFKRHYPADSFHRQPVHTVYGGANLFKAGFAGKLGAIALNTLDAYAPNFAVFARALGLPGADTLPGNSIELAGLSAALDADADKVRISNPAAWLAYTVYTRVVHKLKHEPIEDNRIDFEDGYGNRPDAEEDGHAVAAADEVAKGMAEGVLSPFIGIRIKTFSDECEARSIRTLDIFMTRLAEKTGQQAAGKLYRHAAQGGDRRTGRYLRQNSGKAGSQAGFCQRLAAYGDHDRNHAVDHQPKRREHRAAAGRRRQRALPLGRFWHLRLHRLVQHHRRAPEPFASGLRFCPACHAGQFGRHRHHH